MPVSAEPQLWFSSNEKTYPKNYEIFTATLNKIESSTVKKYYRLAIVKEIVQCRLKNISRGFTTADVGYCIFYSILE